MVIPQLPHLYMEPLLTCFFFNMFRGASDFSACLVVRQGEAALKLGLCALILSFAGCGASGLSPTLPPLCFPSVNGTMVKAPLNWLNERRQEIGDINHSLHSRVGGIQQKAGFPGTES